MARFGRVATAMITPFGDDGSLALDVAADLARWLVDHGNEGLVVAGTTGESATLTHDEQIALIETVVGAVDVPVVAGAGSNDTRAAVDLTERATAAGAAGILSVTPYYNRPSQASLLSHFRTIAASTDLPVMLYDIPGRTGRKIATDTLLELAHDVDNIVALKDAAGDPGETALFLSQAPEGFEVYSGDDKLNLALLAVGAVGVVGVATHWAGIEQLQMVEAVERGDLAEARRLNALLQESFAYETSDAAPNPIPAKTMMRALGLPVGQGRAPMDVVPGGLEATARAIIGPLAVGAELSVGI
ncbi:MAG: 4-hydroxy-tetrahydrodipicolinate synthase [Acidimicrobiales bacterium]